MTEDFNVHLFLTDSEREQLLKLHDVLYDIDYDTEEQMDQGRIWAKVISRLVFGKVMKEGDQIFPLSLRKRKGNESTN